MTRERRQYDSQHYSYILSWNYQAECLGIEHISISCILLDVSVVFIYVIQNPGHEIQTENQ